jgi:spermidine synthase
VKSPPRIVLLAGHEALFADGAVQSLAPGADTTTGYWPLLLPERVPRNALLLGLGGGTVAWLLHERFGPLAITGIDDDAGVLALVQERGWLDVPGLSVVYAEARAWLARCVRRGERFDLIVVDLFLDGRVPGWVCTPRFLRRVAACLSENATATFNLSRGRGHRSRLRLLARFFTIERIAARGMNLVVHVRARQCRYRPAPPARRPAFRR